MDSQSYVSKTLRPILGLQRDSVSLNEFSSLHSYYFEQRSTKPLAVRLVHKTRIRAPTYNPIRAIFRFRCDALTHLSSPTKCSSTLNKFIGNSRRIVLSVFDHFVKLALKGLTKVKQNNILPAYHLCPIFTSE